MNILAEDKFDPQAFFIEYANTHIHGDVLDRVEDTAPKILFLHDEDKSSARDDFKLLRQLLLNQYDLSSCAFDMIGHGETSGEWGSTSLEARTEQTNDIVNSSFDCQPFSIVAMGLSAFTALKMVSVADVSNLVLITPVLPYSSCNRMAFDQLLQHDLLNAEDNLKQIEALASFLDFQGNLATISQIENDRHTESTTRNSVVKSSDTFEHHKMELVESSSELMNFAIQNPSNLARIAQIISDVCAR